MMKAVPIFISRDIWRSAAFYENLGFEVQMYKDNGYMFLKLEGVEFHVRECQWPDHQPNECGAYFYVENADVLYQRFKGSGSPGIMEIAEREWRCREFSIDDPDHNLIRVGSRL